MKKGRVRLKYTGTLSEAEFRERCREQDFWYHTYAFDNGFVQRGHYDIGPDVADYGFPDDMSGMTVLDVGTGTGWFATWFEQHGAKVTATDVRGRCDMDIFGRDHYPDVTSERPVPDRVLPDGREIYYSYLSRGFWIMKDILGLEAEYVNARVYDLCPEMFGGRKFDLVFLGSLLMHLRDPIGGLMAAHRVCRRQLITTSFMVGDREENEPPVMQSVSDVAPISWWFPNRSGLTRWLEAAGFTNHNLDRTVQLTLDEAYAPAGKAAAHNHIQQLVHAFV